MASRVLVRVAQAPYVGRVQELQRWLDLTAAVGQGSAVYPAVALAAALDAVLPLVPSETILISAAVLSVRPGGPAIWLLLIAGAAGAIAGDNAMYWVGRTLGVRAARRLAGGAEAARRIGWATSAIERHGPVLVIAARYVPGGRTAVTLAAGTLAMPWRRFLVADVVAGFSWAAYACLLGRLGGEAFESTWTAILVSAGVAVGLAVGLEGVRRLRSRC